MSALDSDLKEYMLSSYRNATYLSKMSQNDLLACIKKYIQPETVKEIKTKNEGAYFGLSADKVTGVSNWEQLGVIVRYTKNPTPVEKLLEYVSCDDIKGSSIATFLIKTLKNVDLDPMICRSQTYDSAGNISGKVKGAAAIFSSKTGNDKAVYFNCTCHKLNLCLSKASKVPQIYIFSASKQFHCFRC